MVQRKRVRVAIKRRSPQKKRGIPRELLDAIDDLFMASRCVCSGESSPVDMLRIVTARIRELREVEHLLTEHVNICKVILEGLWNNKRLTRP